MMMSFSKLAAIAGIAGILSTGVSAGENRKIKSPVTVSVALVEVQLSKETQCGMDALTIVDPELALGSGAGQIKGGNS